MVKATRFIEELSEQLTSEDVVVTDAGSSFFLTHYIKVKQVMRIITSGGLASMGYGIPASIGSYLALKRRTICITGDGSFSQSIPELQTIVHYKLPIKIFVLNNDGYLSIRLTQKKYFTHFIDEGINSGLSLPSIKNIANAYGIRYSMDMLETLNSDTSMICEVEVDRNAI
jgi:acetolactate synthase-1/2/3 large subunit